MFLDLKATRNEVAPRQGHAQPPKRLQRPKNVSSSCTRAVASKATVKRSRSYGVQECDATSPGTLPPSFTQSIHGQNHHQTKSYHHRRELSLASPSQPGNTPAMSPVEAAAQRTLVEANPALGRSGVSPPLSPPNHGLRPNTSYTPSRARIDLRSRESPPHPPQPSFRRYNNDSISINTIDNYNNSRIPLEQWQRAAGSDRPYRGGERKIDRSGGSHGGGGGSLGLPPKGVVDRSTSAMHFKTDWACPSSSRSTSTPSLHDRFSDGGSRRAAFQTRPYRFRVTPVRNSRSAEGLKRRGSMASHHCMENLGNWPLNTAERWVKGGVTEENAQERGDQLQKIRLERLVDLEKKRAAWVPALDDSSSESGHSYVSEEPEIGEDEEVDEETEREKKRRRKARKALRKKARRERKREAEWKSLSNRGRWHTIGRHGGIVARAQASVPSLTTRGDLVRLKGHADRVLIGKIARYWGVVAGFFGVEHDRGNLEVPREPDGTERKVKRTTADFWELITGSEMHLTPEEVAVVQGRLDEYATKQRINQAYKAAANLGESAIAEEAAGGRGDDEGGESDESVAADGTRISYGQLHGALFRTEDVRALVAAFQREGEMREKDERRVALKRQQFEDSMADRRSDLISEVVKAYSAGLGYRPSTKGKRKKRAISRADPDKTDGGESLGGGDDGGGDDGDNSSQTTADGTVTSSVSVSSSLSSRSNPAQDWWTDGGVSNQWAKGDGVRKALFVSLQAGAVAHMSLKERRAAQVPWVKGVTHMNLRRTKSALIACAKYGRGFQQLTPAEIVLALRVYAAERIQAQWRGFVPRRRFSPKVVALRELVKREQAIREARRRSAFVGWKAEHQARMELMRGTRRAFFRWRIESKRLADTSRLFRGTFWPLYVWRRWTNSRVSSFDKAKFLRKVYLTTVILRHFRAWDRITDSGQRLTVRADRGSQARLNAKKNCLFRWWAARIRQKRFLQKQWIKGGMWLRLKVNTRRVATTFIILRYWAFARSACARRSAANFRSYYLLGELDRRHALTETRTGRQKQWGRHSNNGRIVGTNKRRCENGGKFSTPTSRGGGNSPRGCTAAAGDGSGIDDKRDHQHLPAADDIHRASLESATSCGNGSEDQQSATTTVTQDDFFDESQSGGSGGSGIGATNIVSGRQPVAPLSSRVEGRFCGGSNTLAAGTTNTPIAMLGRPNHVLFPSLLDTPFGDGVDNDRAIMACQVLQDHFNKKEVLKARVNFMLYQRLAPQVLVRLRIKANERQRARYAAYLDARRVQKKHLIAWHLATIHIIGVRKGIIGDPIALSVDTERAEISIPRESRTAILFGLSAADPGGVPGGVKVNPLEEDRKLRRRQVDRATNRLGRMVERTASLKEQSTKDDETIATWTSARQTRERAVAKFLLNEGGRARSADAKAKVFIAGFQQYAGENMVNVIYRIFTAVIDGKRSSTLRKTLRQWRSWYMLRVSVHLYNRQRLRNWLRICARLRYLWRGMPLFHELRVKWSVFHRLLKLVDRRLCYGTPDLSVIFRRRREFLLDYSCLLQERGFVAGHYAPEVLLPATLDPMAIVQRWKQYTQRRAIWRFLTNSLIRRRHHRVARVVFEGWRTGLGPKQRREADLLQAALAAADDSRSKTSSTGVMLVLSSSQITKEDAFVTLGGDEEDTEEEEEVGDEDEEEEEAKMEDGWHRSNAKRSCGVLGQEERELRSLPPTKEKVRFVEARVEVDMEIARRTVIVGWRSSLTRAIGLRQAKLAWRIKRQSRRQPTFKKFMAFHTWQATERVRTEARLLVDAFLNRGHLTFRDQEPAYIVGRNYDHSGGTGLIRFRDKPIPGSHLVCEVRVMTRVGEGVVGVQLVVTAGKRTLELPVHGAAAGENRSTITHSFTVDAPVERLSRFECEHNNGLIERMRVVTSGGRWSPWFGDRLTVLPYQARLPEWKYHSLAATTAVAAVTARRAANAAAAADRSEVSKAEVAAAALAAAEAETAAARAPEWDIQKEYITGLAGLRTHEKLVGLGVVTRHVTHSHVFSYIWEAPQEDERAMSATDDKDGSDQPMLSARGRTPSGTSVAVPGSFASGNSGSGSGSSHGNEPTTLSKSRPSPRSVMAAGATGPAGASGGSGGGSLDVSDNPNGSTISSSESTLSKAEMKQHRFAQEMRDRERKREERVRLAREKEAEMERLLRGGSAVRRGHEDERSREPTSLSSSSMGGASAVGKGGKGRSGPPTPEQEFAGMLRIRRTDARVALERSVALARRARTYSGNSANGFDDAGGALSTLTVVAGLTNWLHSALLPQLVPLPALATTTTEMFHQGEEMLFAARATKDRGITMRRAADKIIEAQKTKRRRGVMSPVQRAKEVEDRKNLAKWETESITLMDKARRQREEGEQLLNAARERLPKVSQSVKTVRMYLAHLKLSRRQIELEREFGLGALKSKGAGEGGRAGGRKGLGERGGSHKGGWNGGAQHLPICCGVEESMFDATIKSLLQEREKDNVPSEGKSRAVGDTGGVRRISRGEGGGARQEERAYLDTPFLSPTDESLASLGPDNSALGTVVSSVNPWS